VVDTPVKEHRYVVNKIASCRIFETIWCRISFSLFPPLTRLESVRRTPVLRRRIVKKYDTKRSHLQLAALETLPAEAKEKYSRYDASSLRDTIVEALDVELDHVHVTWLGQH
jgi:hypothetical protein